MKPPPFRYVVPETVEEALHLLAEHGDEAKPLAGGQSLIPAMNFRLARPAVLVDLGRLHQLDFIEDRGEELHVGAMTRQRTVELSPAVAKHVPLVAGTLPHVAHFQIRNRGTFGGNLAHADPCSELPAVLLALEGRCRIAGAGGTRWVRADDFFVDLFATACAECDLLVEVALPKARPGDGWGFHELSRRHGDYALVGAAAHVRVEDGRCTEARVVLHSVGETPVLVKGSGAALLGADVSGEEARGQLVAQAAEAARGEIDPPGDLQASPEYRRHLAQVLTRRALHDALRRALGLDGKTPGDSP